MGRNCFFDWSVGVCCFLQVKYLVCGKRHCGDGGGKEIEFSSNTVKGLLSRIILEFDSFARGFVTLLQTFPMSKRSNLHMNPSW